MSDRAGERLRKQSRQAWRASAQRNWWLLARVVLLWAVLAAGDCFLPIRSWWRGYLFGLLAMAAVVVVALAIHGSSGARSSYLGQIGEESTAAAVGGLRARARGWRVVHNLVFAGHGDVDHVLLASGAVYAIESKFTSVPWAVTDGKLTGPPEEPLRQARTGARKIEAMLRYGRERLDVRVQPMVVLWGPGAPEIDGGFAVVDGVLVCEGRQRARWARYLGGDLHISTMDAAFAVVSEHRRRVDRDLRTSGTLAGSAA